MRKKYIDPANIPPRKLDSTSITIPDQALSVRQILERYAVGSNVDASLHEGSFDNDADFDDFAPSESPDFDLADIQQERELLLALREVSGDESRESPAEAPPPDPPKQDPSTEAAEGGASA